MVAFFLISEVSKTKGIFGVSPELMPVASTTHFLFMCLQVKKITYFFKRVLNRGGQLLNYWGCAFIALGMPNLPPEEKNIVCHHFTAQ